MVLTKQSCDIWPFSVKSLDRCDMKKLLLPKFSSCCVWLKSLGQCKLLDSESYQKVINTGHYKLLDSRSYWTYKLLNRKVTGKYKLLDSANYWTVKVIGP
jgi:hypothetical protein